MSRSYLYFALVAFLGLANAKQKIIATGTTVKLGSCGIVADFSNSDLSICAMNEKDFGGSYKTPKCGKCLKIKTQKGEVMCTVQSMCSGDCTPGTIKISLAGAARLHDNPTEGTAFEGEWEEEDCPQQCS